MGNKHFMPAMPADTYQNARRIYNIQHVYLRIGDRLDEIVNGINLRELDPSSSISAENLVRLALITAFQYAEALPDPAASQAVQQRMDWKYALYLPVNFPAIPASALCGFRANLFSSPKGVREFGGLLVRLAAAGLISTVKGNIPEPLEALMTVCMLTRLYDLRQAMKASLAMLGSTAPDWLRAVARPHWYERYSQPDSDQSANVLADVHGLEEEANLIGADVLHLLDAAKSQLPGETRGRAELRNLAQKYEEQYHRGSGPAQWLPPSCGGCSCRYSIDNHL